MKSMIFLCIFVIFCSHSYCQEQPLTFDEFINKSNTITSDLPSSEQVEQSLPPVLSEDQSEQISQYFEEALKNYEDILNDQQAAEVRTTEKRIESNRQLLQQHQQSLGKSETTLRQVKLEYIRRFQALKSAKEQGLLDEKTYNQQLAKMAEEYRYKVANLTSDRDFYKGQTDKTEARLKNLEELQKINKIVLSQEQDLNPQTKPQRPLTELEKMMQGIRALQCFENKNFAKQFK